MKLFVDFKRSNIVIQQKGVFYSNMSTLFWESMKNRIMSSKCKSNISFNIHVTFKANYL